MSKHPKKISIILLLPIIFLVASCNHRPAWIVRMLDKPVCLAPCWENITPGITTWDEISQKLKQSSNAFDITTIVVGDPGGPVISWCEDGSPCGTGSYIYALAAFNNNMIVQEINLRPGIPLHLKDFIPLYGPPEEIAFADTYSDPESVLVAIPYPKLGLVLEFDTKNQGTLNRPTVNFRKDLDVFSITYTLPGLDFYYSNNLGVKSVEPLQHFEWKGYTNYP